MKKIMTFVILLFIVLSIQAQANLPYKSLSDFKSDTTAFMRYNFLDRADYYKGKTVNDVIADLSRSNINVKSYIYEVQKDHSTDGVIVIPCIHICIYELNLLGKKLSASSNGKNDKINGIALKFETPIEHAPNRNLFTNNPDQIFKPEIKNLFGPRKLSEVVFIE